MLRATVRLIIILLSVIAMQAAEPLAGRWLLVSQVVGNRKMPTDALMLRVNPAGKAFDFAYSVPVNDVQFVSLKFSVRLDGTETDVLNAKGQKIGTVTLTKAGAAQYRIILQGQNPIRARPDRRVQFTRSRFSSDSICITTPRWAVSSLSSNVVQ